MTFTFGMLVVWYALAVVVAVWGLASEGRDRGESASSALRAAVSRGHDRFRAVATSLVPVSRGRSAPSV